MEIAGAVSSRSGDPNTKVGCVIVDQSRRIVGTGYNHYPAGFDPEKETFQKPEAYDYIIHAEIQALLYSKREDLKGSTVYTTISPCVDCAKALAAAGITTVIYKEPYKNCLKGLDVLQYLGVNVERLDGN